MKFDEWLGVTGAAGSPREYLAYLRASRWRQARPDAVKNVNNSFVGPQRPLMRTVRPAKAQLPQVSVERTITR